MSDRDFTIRPATPDDATSLAALQSRVFVSTYGAAIPPPTLAAYVERTFAPEQVAKELSETDSTHLVAVYNGAIVGVSKLVAGTPASHHLRNAVELARLYVDEAWHGRGVGKELLLRSFATAREQSHVEMWLCAWEHNARALTFYHKHGFAPFGQIPVFVDDVRFDDLLMRRKLHDR